MKMALAMTAVLLASLALTGSAQPPPPAATCGSKLIPCAPFLNATNPPESCCGPLKEELTTDLACLCTIFKSPEILKAFHINLTDALQLPKNCGLSSFSNACTKTAAAPGASLSPPATSGGGHNFTTQSMTWFGLSSLASFLLFWWSVMA